MIKRLKTEVLELTCERCGHIWRSTKCVPPVRCSKCRTPYWNKEKQKKGDKNDSKTTNSK